MTRRTGSNVREDRVEGGKHVEFRESQITGAGAVTFTFEDNAPSHYTDVAPLFDKYGYKASFYIVTDWVSNWHDIAKLANAGHEIGSHSDSHPYNMVGEEASSKKTIDAAL